MTTADFIIALFHRIDNQMFHVPKHPQAALYPSETVTLGILYALKGGGKRAFYRWLVRDWLAFFPRLPERTRLFRLFAATRIGPTPSGRSLRRWALLIAMALS